MNDQTHHGSCVLVGRKAVLLRGPSGAGKSLLAFQLLRQAPETSGLFCKLVADDRVQLENTHGRVVARAPVNLAGLLELRGVGIMRVPFEPQAQLGLVVDIIAASDNSESRKRLPEPQDLVTTLAGVQLPYLILKQDDRAAMDTICTAMNLAGNYSIDTVENAWTGLAETDELVLSKVRTPHRHI